MAPLAMFRHASTMSDPNRFRFDEGTAPFPPGYEDRTVNSFVPADPRREPNLSISRDRFTAGESLADYVSRQVAALKKKLPGYKAEPVVRIELAGSGLSGLLARASYRSGATTVHQRQAVFAISDERALVFTMSSPRPLDAAADALWTAWLAGVELEPGA
jgi:hypothetical protein